MLKVGDVVGRWTVVAEAERRNSQRCWACRCSCGKESVIRENAIQRGESQSCGCLRREKHIERIRDHGLSETAEYKVWSHLISRCTNPKDKSYKDYGGRGISVSPSWLSSFTSFLRDVGPRPTSKHSLDRTNNNGNYDSENAHWILRSKQNRNKRSNKVLSIGSESLCLVDWVERTTLLYHTVKRRLMYGWTPEEALGFVPHQDKRKIPKSSNTKLTLPVKF